MLILWREELSSYHTYSNHSSITEVSSLKIGWCWFHICSCSCSANIDLFTSPCQIFFIQVSNTLRIFRYTLSHAVYYREINCLICWQLTNIIPNIIVLVPDMRLALEFAFVVGITFNVIGHISYNFFCNIPGHQTTMQCPGKEIRCILNGMIV